MKVFITNNCLAPSVLMACPPCYTISIGPTMVKEVRESKDVMPKVAVQKNIHARKLIGYNAPPKNDFLESRLPLLINSDIHIGVAAPRQSMTSYFYKNADADEMLFIHKGTGTLRTLLGNYKI